MIGAGTLEDVGLGFRALYRAVSHPGTIHFLGWACSPFQMALTLPRIYFGKPHIRPDTSDVSGTTIVLRGKDTLHYMVDGDLLTANEVIEIKISRPISLVVPRN